MCVLMCVQVHKCVCEYTRMCAPLEAEGHPQLLFSQKLFVLFTETGSLLALELPGRRTG